MGKAFPLLMIICFCLISALCTAQTSVKVSDPRLEIRDNTLHISYDILNSDSSDKFNVRVYITDVDGNNIKANSLQGDIGNDVSGGSNKHVTWDLKADKIVMKAEILLSIYAELVPPSENLAIDENNVPTEVASREVSRTGIILQSLALPGLGLTRLKGNPHWIKGLAGYGCIAGSIAFNRAAIDTYKDLSSSETIERAESLLANSTRQDNISEVLAYAAIGIWVSDIIWAVFGSSEINKQHLLSQARRISVSTGFETLSNSPTLGIRYRF